MLEKLSRISTEFRLRAGGQKIYQGHMSSFMEYHGRSSTKMLQLEQVMASKAACGSKRGIPLVKHSWQFFQPAKSNNGPELERNNFMGPELLEKLQILGDRGA